MEQPTPLIPKHGGYRNLKSFQMARLAYDITVRFCDKFIDKKSRTVDQMTQAARSGVQNIAEGSQASGTSKKTELKLTNVARASLEELKPDYEDFLRHRGYVIWKNSDQRRSELHQLKLSTATEGALWVKKIHLRDGDPIPQIAANMALVIIAVACTLLDRQIATLAKSFTENGGFTERLYRIRYNARSRS